MDTTLFEEGLYKSGRVIDKTLMVLNQDMEELCAYLHGRLTMGRRPIVSWRRGIQSHALASVYRMRTNFNVDEKLPFSIIVYIVPGISDRFSKELGKPFLSWQILCTARKSIPISPYSYDILPCSDSNDEDFEPCWWDAKLNKSESVYTHFHEFSETTKNRSLIFYTRIFNDGNTSIIATEDFKSFIYDHINRLVNKIRNKNFVPNYQEFARYCINLEWDEDGGIYRPKKEEK